MRKLIFLIAAGGLICATSQAAADTFDATPSEVAALPEDGSGISRVAARFDVSGLPNVPGLLVSEACLQWKAGMFINFPSEFWVEKISEAWNPQSIVAGLSSVKITEVLDEWDIFPEDYARAEGLVRLKLDSALNEWLANPLKNFGVVLNTRSVTTETLAEQGGTIRLVVRYSLVKPALADSTIIALPIGTEP